MEKYEHILNIPYNKSTKRKQMSLNDRAAQFAPFAALTGYEESIAETGRLTDKQITLNQQAKELISKKLNYIIDNKITDLVEIKYFIPDERKTGGMYKTVISRIKRVDTVNRLVILEDNSKLEIYKIVEIHLPNLDSIFHEYY